MEIEKLNVQKVIFVCSVFVLFIKMVLTNMQLGKARMNTQTRASEDTKTFAMLNKKDQPVTEEHKEYERRVFRQIMNDLENIPIGLFVLLISSWVNHTSQGIITNDICILVFTITRVIYTLCYVYALQPWRTIFYFVAILSVLASGINGIIEASKLVN